MAEFDFKELVARAHFDYVGPAFPLWWKNNKTKFVFPNLMGIGKELIKRIQKEISKDSMLLLLSAPSAMEYYPKVKFEKVNNGFIINRK